MPARPSPTVKVAPPARRAPTKAAPATIEAANTEAPATQRWRLLLAYDGRGFRGFAAQPGAVTVAGVLSEALTRVTRVSERLAVTCAGRTDAGVHAAGQVVHVDLPAVLPTIRRGGTSRTWPAPIS